jgi:putative endonuclease
MYFVYILQSSYTNRFYIGSTNNLIRRFHQHQTNQVNSTKNRGPWFMPYYEIYQTRSDVVNRELELKHKKSSKYISELIKRH